MNKGENHTRLEEECAESYEMQGGGTFVLSVNKVFSLQLDREFF